MEFSRLSNSECEEYQPLALASGAFLQDPQWGRFQESLGREVSRFGVSRDGKPLGYAQCITSKALNRKYMSAPYGPIFAAGMDESAIGEAFKAIAEGMRSAGRDVAFFRVEPEMAAGESLKQPGFSKSIDLNPHRTVVLDLSRGEEEISAGMKPKTRYNIKIAERDGVEVRVLDQLPVDGSGDDPLQESARRAGIRTYSRDYFNSLLKFFADAQGPIVARCYAAYHRQDLLAAVIILHYGDTATYLFGGQSGLKRNMMPNYLLHWQAIRDAKAAGLKRYDFWGIETDPKHPWYGFSTFKLGFGGRMESRPGTYDYVYNRAWYTAYNALRALNRMKNSVLKRKS
jgi:lipid II:glycine glycyltransferase (peptidoglycan interpeptide bridge formation enzyme)